MQGLLAYGIGFMDGVQGHRAWRWVFILEVRDSHSSSLPMCISCATPLYFDLSRAHI